MSLIENYDFLFDGDQSIRPSKKRGKKQVAKPESTKPNFSLELKQIFPKTKNQKRVFDFCKENNNILLYGTAGTGKTFLSLYFALNEVLHSKSVYRKVVILRSMVPSRDSGFLPGSIQEKSRVYEAPYTNICAELFGRGDAYELLKKHGVIDFETTSYLRGTTLRDCIIILDEFQNLTDQEIFTIMTRPGENTKMMIAGDTRQDDLTGKKHEHSGGALLIKIINSMPSFKHVCFEVEDIVRSDLVKEWIIAREKLGI